jgi:hypothetical protein
MTPEQNTAMERAVNAAVPNAASPTQIAMQAVLRDCIRLYCNELVTIEIEKRLQGEK